MEQYSLDFYRELSRESDVGLRAKGNVGFYSTEDRLRAGVGVLMPDWIQLETGLALAAVTEWAGRRWSGCPV